MAESCEVKYDRRNEKKTMRAKGTSVHTFSEVNPKNIFGETSLKNLP